MFLTLPNKIGSFFYFKEVQTSVVWAGIDFKENIGFEHYINYNFGYLFG
jgi:hypothetical protein